MVRSPVKILMNRSEIEIRMQSNKSSKRALEQNTGQEIQTLQKVVVNRFEKKLRKLSNLTTRNKRYKGKFNLVGT